ncbi:RAQPRD family integrative conjugative element protein [Pasteurella oralis]|uniref:integrative conjugative element protein, RAQPRD family n=1 Tax=Pasteurella oralis TaxID=1071947 RepID=UPI001FEAB93D|nr:RAQPRD family integrative conjugative element protein [Pasteurella oralis]
MKNAFPTLLIMFSLGISTLAYAGEQAELEQAIRQLKSAQQALVRAENNARSSGIKNRIYFDYDKAHKEIETISSGIYFYINSDRAQPRDPRQLSTLTGEYNKQRVNK